MYEGMSQQRHQVFQERALDLRQTRLIQNCQRNVEPLAQLNADQPSATLNPGAPDREVLVTKTDRGWWGRRRGLFSNRGCCPRPPVLSTMPLCCKTKAPKPFFQEISTPSESSAFTQA